MFDQEPEPLFPDESPYIQGTLNVSIKTVDGYVNKDTGLAILYDRDKHIFTIPFGDTVNAEDCIRIVHQGLKRAIGMGVTETFPD